MRINDPSPSRLPRAFQLRRDYGAATLHTHNRTIEMSINADVRKRLGWNEGDQVFYKIEGDTLIVKKMEL